MCFLLGSVKYSNFLPERVRQGISSAEETFWKASITVLLGCTKGAPRGCRDGGRCIVDDAWPPAGLMNNRLRSSQGSVNPYS